VKALPAILILLTLCGCTIGSSTTDRPALDTPPIGPDGTFWSALDAARRDDSQAFLYTNSPGFLHNAFLSDELPEPESQDGLEDLHTRIQARLEDGAARNGVTAAAEKERLAAGYMKTLRELAKDQFIEVAKPVYGNNIRYKDEHGRAWGPNKLGLDVRIYPRTPVAEDFEPKRLRVGFIQDRFRWLIESLEPDELHGAFTWTR
jgi:hypothetical protein